MTTASNTQPKIALVTGGSRGLGRATALALARRGRGVAITYQRNESAATDVVSAIEALGQRAVALQLDAGDITRFPAFATALTEALRATWSVDRFDFLVNNAGTGIAATFAQTTPEQFDELLDVHFKGVFFLTQTLLPHIADGGRIINLSSGLTRFTSPVYPAYAAMKGAVEVLTRYLAAELGPRRIGVNTFAPGAIETDFGGGVVRDNADLNRQIAAGTALGRVGRPDDIGPAIASLLDEENYWINGQRIEASGGVFL